MRFIKLLPKQSLNKAYLTEKLIRSAIGQSKQNFSAFLSNTNEDQIVHQSGLKGQLWQERDLLTLQHVLTEALNLNLLYKNCVELQFK